MIRSRWLVHGIVQGVGFRYFVRTAAQRLGLAGWVRNLDTGSVELEVEGEASQVEEFKRVVERGPDGAVIERVDDAEPEGSLPLPHPFAIRR